MTQESIFGPYGADDTRAEFARQRLQGIHHHRHLSPLLPQPADSPVLSVTIGPGQPIDEVVCLLLEPEALTIPFERVRTEWDTLLWGYVEVWQATLPPRPRGTLVRYQIRAHDLDSGESIWADDGREYSYLVGDDGPPAWSIPAVIYQIFPDRFYPGDGRDWNKTDDLNAIHGGTLRGVIDKLDYIAGLGFTAIWLNPFFPDDTHHGYHATDYFAVNPRLGTMDDMRELVEKAHERGIRLLLDFVANHWGSNHATFRDARTNAASPYRDWYYWQQWPDDYVMYYDVADLPKLNTDHPAVRDHLLRSVGFWLGEIGFDGLRLDHADGPSMDFWTDVRAVARSVRPDAWMIGELIRPADQQLSYGGLFDGTLDFLLTQALRATFGTGRMDLATFDAFLGRHEAYFPAAFSRPSFVDNHDMDRFLWLAGGDKRKLKLASLCHFTLGGPPVVYNGTEMGMSQTRSMRDEGSQGMAECRQPTAWGAQDDDLVAFFWWLIHLRRDHPVLWRGRRRTMHLNAAAGTYAYAREDGLETAIVGFNLSDHERQFTVIDRIHATRHTFTLPPWSGDVSFS